MNKMSVEEFTDQILEALEQEKINTKKLIQELIKELPDRESDESNACLYCPLSKGWSQTIEDVLENSGYEVLFLPNSQEYVILFSESTIEEMGEERNKRRKR